MDRKAAAMALRINFLLLLRVAAIRSCHGVDLSGTGVLVFVSPGAGTSFAGADFAWIYFVM